VIFVVGNKTDLYDKEEVKTQEGANFAKVKLFVIGMNLNIEELRSNV